VSAVAALDRAASIEDLRRLARRRLPRAVFDFIDGGAGDERTLRENRRAFDAWHLMPRVGVDVGASRSLATRIVGVEARLPLVLAPIGLAGLFAPGGEIAAARAAAAAGIPFCLSTNSVASIEEVAMGTADSPGDRWFQLYVLRDRGLTHALLERAAGAGYRVLCVTVDLPVQGRRERDLRNAFTVPLRPGPGMILDLALRPRWLLGVLRSPVRFGNFGGAAPQGFTSVARHVATLFDPSAGWDDVARLRERWPGPVVVKGVLHPDDARRAVDTVGAAAVVVSNHGGRQLDTVLSGADALPAVVDEIGDELDVLVDGGIRRGTDVLKALALGARAVMIGRPVLWGLAVDGPKGVKRVLEILLTEFDGALAIAGAPRTSDLDRSFVMPAPWAG
jgi:isopentenyl diphosphate isomerase/L-lactate dehydrogenase-like FMN-dependent dehydrogenase